MIRVRRGCWTAALVIGTLVSSCSTPANAPSGAGAQAAPLVIPPVGDASAPPQASTPRAFRYELVLSATEGKTSTRSSFSLDLAEGAPASISFGKNARIGTTLNRSDVGTKLEPRLTFEGDTPRLDVEANVSWIDAAGKGHRLKTASGAPTPPGEATVIFDAAQDGRQLRLTASPTPLRSLGGGAPSAPPKEGYVADVSLSHGEGITTAKQSTLTLSRVTDEAARAKTTDSFPLGSADGGVVPRFDVGMRVKMSARPEGAGVALDLELEVSGLEANEVIRKFSVRCPLFAPLDAATPAFAGEEDGHRYLVTVTPHRAK